MRRILLLLLIVSLTGCVPYSDNPLTDPGQQPMDSAVNGTWYWKDGDEVGFVHMGLDRETKMLMVYMVEFGQEGELKVSELAGHTSSVGDHTYFNLKWVNAKDENPGYLFVQYEAKGDVLELSLMNNEAAEKAITDGLVKGEVVKEKWTSSAHLTADRDSLAQFVAKHDKELFSEKNPLHRLKPPDVPKVDK